MKKIRIHTQVHHPGSGSDFQDLPDEWAEWDAACRSASSSVVSRGHHTGAYLRAQAREAAA